MKNPLTISIVSRDAVIQRVNELRGRDADAKARVGLCLRKLWNPDRDLIQGAEPQVFDDLQTRFPNFDLVIDYWRTEAMVSRKLGLAFQPQPVLLGGLPGLGKTFFASEAAKVMGLYFSEISMATVTAAFVLGGGSLQWGNGVPGFIAKSICLSQVGNPLLLIDEVDKAMEGNYNPMGPLYPLLERHSARRFRDEALELEMDASHIIWVATANEIHHIPEPIVSRMKYFDIRKPTPVEMETIVNSIYAGIKERESYGKLLDAVLPADTIQRLTDLLPREARKTLEEACKRAIGQNRVVVLPEDIIFTNGPGHRPIGFL